MTGIVIGAGHNGMITAGYLGKSGLKVAVVEKNMEVGGGLDAHEDINYPGFWHNIHSVFHRGVSMLPWYRDLELERFGIHYYKPDPGVVQHFLDKSYLGWFADVERTAATIRHFSPKDAETFQDPLAPLAASGREHRLPGDVCAARTDRGEAAALREDGGGARVPPLLRHHPRGVHPRPLRAPEGAGLHRVPRRHARLRAGWRRRPATSSRR